MTDTDKKDDTGKLTMGDIRKIITDEIGKAVKTPTPTDDKGKQSDSDDEKDTQPRSIRSAVEREVSRIREADERKKKDEAIDAKLAELSEATKEKPPVERRRVHRFMGWGEN